MENFRFCWLICGVEAHTVCRKWQNVIDKAKRGKTQERAKDIKQRW